MIKIRHNQTGLAASILHLLHRSGQQAEILFLREMGGEDITPRQFAVLLSVDANEDISQTGLVDLTGIDRSTLADVVGRLATRGLLTRKRTRHDARMYAVRLTATGKAVLENAKPRAQKADELVLSVLPTSERAAFLEVLARVVGAMDKVVQNDNAEIKGSAA